MKKKCIQLFCVALMLCMFAALLPVVAPSAQAASQNQKNIVARADYMYNSTWVCRKTTTCCAYGSYYTFYEGNTYRIPYGQNTSTGAYIGYGVSVETFLNAANDVNSEFYAYTGTNGYNGYYSFYYATDCSGFVSYCWDATYKQSTRSLANISTWIGDVNTYNCTYNLQLGDALNRYDYHVVLVTGLSYDSSGAITQIEITESTIPTLKRSYYTPAELADNYSSYDGIYRYYGTVDAPPNTDHWDSDSTGFYYQYADGSYAIGWAYIDNNWYYFSSSGYMYTGWLFDDAKQCWYYLDPNTGIMRTGWILSDGYYYYMDSSGKMLLGWQMIDGYWFYLNTTDHWPTGAMFTGFHEIDGEMYYFNELSDGTKGAMLTGWVNVEGRWYYFNPDGGAMLYGWQMIDGSWYYLHEDTGIMASREWILDDGVWYYVNASGAMTKGAEWDGDFESALDIGTGFYATIDIPLTGTRAGVDSDPNSETYQNVEVQAVRAEDASDYNEQLWYFERRDEDNSYRITNVATGMVMDQIGGYVEAGTNVRVCPNYESLAQRWFVFENGDHYCLVTACSVWDMTVLDIADGLADEGTNIRIWPQNGSGAQQFAVTPIHKEHTYVGGVCTECGEADPDYVPVTLAGKSFSLSFEDEVLVNFYYTVSDMTDVTEHGMLVFNTNPGTVDLANADAVYSDPIYVASGDMYLTTTAGIAAKEMGDNRYYAAYAKLTDGSYVYSAAYEYSPRKYAMNMLGKSSTSDKQKALCVAMLNYGAAAQKYFGYKTEMLMNADLTADQKNLVIGYDAALFKGAIPADTGKLGSFAATAGFDHKAATVSFDSAFAINYYFTPSNPVSGSMEMYYWNSSDYAAASVMTPDNATGKCTMALQSSGSYWAQVEGIAAKALDETYYVAAVYTDAGGNRYCTGVVAYSLSRYCLNNAKEGKDMQELAANTAMYGHYAKFYFA